MTQYDPDSLFGHGIRIKELEDRLSGSEKITANKLTELEQKIEHIEEYYIEEGVGERLEKLEIRIDTIGKAHENDIKDIDEEISELQKSIDHLKACDIADTKSIEELKEAHFEGCCHPTKTEYIDLIIKAEKIKSVLKELLEAHDGEFDDKWTEEVYKQLEDGENFLNPHLQCDGECYRCEDNIPSHGNAPNQCGRQQSKEKPSKEIVYCTFYNGGKCWFYGSNDYNESLFCKDINCKYKKKPSSKCEHAWCETLDNKQICSFCGKMKPSEPSNDEWWYDYKNDCYSADFIRNTLKRIRGEIIAEFLRDWRWGRCHEGHRTHVSFQFGRGLRFNCKCCGIESYWFWFEKKWQKELEK